MARTIGNAGTWHFGIVLTTITIVITIVFHPELLSFEAWCLVAFREVIMFRSHEIFKLASKPGNPNIWRFDSVKNIRKFSSSISWLYEGRQDLEKSSHVSSVFFASSPSDRSM